MSIDRGTRLGPYEIVAPLGAGGMGEVYRARDTRLDRVVAIKILPSALGSDPHFRERFDREARAISQLDHPHICTLHDVGEQDGTAFLVMPCLEGETLEARLKNGALPLDQALQLAIQVADALDKAHRAGIVHRDLKPGNVMITKAGAMLLDFGLAKTTPIVTGPGLSVLPTTPQLTAQGTILGTFQYMAPEQIEGQEADARTDLFAFGVVLYEMLTGRKAFEGKTQASLIGAILRDQPPPIGATRPLTPPALDRIVKKCLAKDPERRWQTAHDLRDELTWVGEERGRVTSAAAPPPHAVWRERAAWVAAGAALVTVAATGVWAVRRSAPDARVVRFDVVTPPSSDLTSFALSPDGRQLVFAAAAEGLPTLWVRPLDELAARPLLGTAGATYPFWSPDGRAIAFFADGKLKRIDVSGGTPQVLADAPYPRGGTWSSDGVILFTPTSTLFDPTGVVTRVSAVGGAAMPLTRLATGHASHRWPQFLPDGRRYLFLSAFGRPDTLGAYLGSLDGGDPMPLLPAETTGPLFAPPNHLLVMRQGTLRALHFDPDRGVIGSDDGQVADSLGTDGTVGRNAFSVSTVGVLAYRATGGSQRRQLVWVDRAGKQLGTMGPADDTGMANLSLDPTGRRVVLPRNVGGKTDVWIIDVDGQRFARLTFGPGNNLSPLWSADGSRVFFESTHNGAIDVFEKAASGVGEERLVHPRAGIPLSVSADGRFVLVMKNDPSTKGDIWALPLNGDRAPLPVAQTGADERGGQFSPDGHWVAYESNASDRFEIYVKSFPTASSTWQISVDGGTQPRWSRDGKELFFVGTDARLIAVSLRPSADGKTLEPAMPVALFRTRLASGSGIAAGQPQYVVAPDGRFLMNVVVQDVSAPPITVVVNWPAALKK